MNSLRKIIDAGYPILKPAIFLVDPETAHEKFTDFMRFLYNGHWDETLLGFDSDGKSKIKISNAAGFNKNGLLPPTTMKHLGFDRVVVGTVTGEKYDGNPKPRIKRFPQTNSMVNWMGLPGFGAEEVAMIMESYGEHGVPITINISPTPGTGNIFEDLKKSIGATKDLYGVDRFEVNISCPNTGEEEMKRYVGQLVGILDAVDKTKNKGQEVYLKVSPDLTERDVEEIVNVSQSFRVNGYVTTNTTTEHNPIYIAEEIGKGGASGDAVFVKSLKVQEMFYEKLKCNPNAKIIPCGGISSRLLLELRLFGNVDEIQVFTPLIYQGPKLLRELKR